MTIKSLLQGDSFYKMPTDGFSDSLMQPKKMLDAMLWHFHELNL